MLNEKYLSTYPLFKNCIVDEDEFSRQAKLIEPMIQSFDQLKFNNTHGLFGIICSSKCLFDLEVFMFDLIPNLTKMKKLDILQGLGEGEQSELSKFYEVNSLRIKFQMFDQQCAQMGLGSAYRFNLM